MTSNSLVSLRVFRVTSPLPERLNKRAADIEGKQANSTTRVYGTRLGGHSKICLDASVISQCLEEHTPDSPQNKRFLPCTPQHWQSDEVLSSQSHLLHTYMRQTAIFLAAFAVQYR